MAFCQRFAFPFAFLMFRKQDSVDIFHRDNVFLAIKIPGKSMEDLLVTPYIYFSQRTSHEPATEIAQRDLKLSCPTVLYEESVLQSCK